jgi:hypothetical protein
MCWWLRAPAVACWKAHCALLVFKTEPAPEIAHPGEDLLRLGRLMSMRPMKSRPASCSRSGSLPLSNSYIRHELPVPEPFLFIRP